MINLKKPSIDDIDIIRPYFGYTRSNASEHTVGIFFMWAEYQDTKYVIYEDTLIVSVNIEGVGEGFFVPIGKNIPSALNEIEKYASLNKMNLQYVDVTDMDMAILEERYNVTKEIRPDWVDYVYNASDLISFSGRKYHGQKNHINYFKKTYTNFSFKEFDNSDISELMNFLEEFKTLTVAGSDSFEEEFNKSVYVICNNDKYKFMGLILKVDNKIVGLCMGEIVKDTLFVHIEKANRKYRGAYPILVNEFAKRYATNVKYINREDSANDTGLKESKMQYHPCFLLDKYIVKLLSNK